MPGSREDMHKFITNAQDNSKIQAVINLPYLSVVFNTKHLYEVIYNRFVFFYEHFNSPLTFSCMFVKY